MRYSSPLEWYLSINSNTTKIPAKRLSDFLETIPDFVRANRGDSPSFHDRFRIFPFKEPVRILLKNEARYPIYRTVIDYAIFIRPASSQREQQLVLVNIYDPTGGDNTKRNKRRKKAHALLTATDYLISKFRRDFEKIDLSAYRYNSHTRCSTLFERIPASYGQNKTS